MAGRRPSAASPGGLAVAIVVVGITYLSLIVGRTGAEAGRPERPERIAALVAGAMGMLVSRRAPAVWFLRHSTDAVLRLLGAAGEAGSTVTDEEVRAWSPKARAAGVFHAAERDMIDGVMRLADRPVRSIMTPRVEIIWLDLSDTAGRSQVDHRERPFALSRQPRRDRCGRRRRPYQGPARPRPDRRRSIWPRAPPAARRARGHAGAEAARNVRAAPPVHMAIVVDEYGSVEGIVTPTDILAAIAGELREDEGEAEPAAVRRDDGSWLMDGMIGIDEAERYLSARPQIGRRLSDARRLRPRALGHMPKPASISSGTVCASRSSTWTAAASTVC